MKAWDPKSDLTALGGPTGCRKSRPVNGLTTKGKHSLVCVFQGVLFLVVSYDFGQYIMFYASGFGFDDFIDDREMSPPNPYDIELRGGMQPVYPIHDLRDSIFPEQNFGICFPLFPTTHALRVCV